MSDLRDTSDPDREGGSAWIDAGPEPWRTDRSPSLELAAAIIRTRFPAVDATGLRHIGHGWEFDAFLTVDGWLFRFPRRAEWSNRFGAEAAVVGLVADALPAHMRVPRVELMGEPAPGFPYRVAGHRFIPGVAAHAVPDTFLSIVASDIGAFLGMLHSIPANRGRAIGLPAMDATHEAGAAQFRRRVIADAQPLRSMDVVVDRAVDALEREAVPSSYFRVPLQMIHADLTTDHVIVDPGTGHLSGVIDWTDTMLGDAARDFVFLAAWRGWEFVEELLRHYPREVDAAFRVRLGWMARLLSVYWLEVAMSTSRDVARHLSGVRAAFER